MNDMTLFLDLILLASGVYCMYTWLRLAVTKMTMPFENAFFKVAFALYIMKAHCSAFFAAGESRLFSV